MESDDANSGEDPGLTGEAKEAELLFECAYAGNLARLRELASPENVDLRHLGRTPLMVAAATPNNFGLPVVEHLLRLGARAAARDASGRTSAHFAVTAGNRQVIRLLHAADGSLVNATDQRGRTPLMMATIRNDCEFVALLLQLGADCRLRDGKGRTALQLAKQFEAWSCYIRIQQVIDSTLLSREDKQELLRLEAESRRICQLAQRGDSMQLQRLLNASNCNCRWRSRTPLMWAAITGGEGPTKCTELLLRFGADDCVGDSYGRTVGHFAAMTSNARILEQLSTVCINSDDYDGTTPLMLAVRCGSCDIVRLLLNLKATIGATDIAGNTAMTFAKDRLDVAMQDLLARRLVRR